ncbi:MAG: hypothetical protein OIF36_02285 [Alphaproteobacteria bacterium]|nr:hypothetical protein [Alphaproteobacteria bacterium]
MVSEKTFQETKEGLRKLLKERGVEKTDKELNQEVYKLIELVYLALEMSNK